MTQEVSCSAVDEMLEAVAACLTRASAEALLNLRASASIEARLEYLADRCTEGLLTLEEREEYETSIRLGELVALLQMEVRSRISTGQTA